MAGDYLDKVYLQTVIFFGKAEAVSIQSFACSDTERLFRVGRARQPVAWASIQRIALRKLDMLDYASQLFDLRAPPGNRLEALKGDLDGFHSIRINRRWRIVFRWTDRGPTSVRIADYH